MGDPELRRPDGSRYETDQCRALESSSGHATAHDADFVLHATTGERPALYFDPHWGGLAAPVRVESGEQVLGLLRSLAAAARAAQLPVAFDARQLAADITVLWLETVYGAADGALPFDQQTAWMAVPMVSVNERWVGRVRFEERHTPSGTIAFDRLTGAGTTPPTLREVLRQHSPEISDHDELLNDPGAVLDLVSELSLDGDGGIVTVLLPLPREEVSAAQEAIARHRASLVAAADEQYRCDQDSRLKARRCEQGTDVWHRARRPITASTVGTILGLNTFQTPFGETLAKICPQRFTSCAMNFGTFFEDMAQHMYIEWASKRFDEVVVTNMGTEIIEKPFEYCSLSPDGLVQLRRGPGGPKELGVLEYKCPGRGQFLDADGEALKISLLEKPEYYAQVQFEMHMFKKLGQPRDFTHFVFLSYDIAPRRMERAQTLFPTASDLGHLLLREGVVAENDHSLARQLETLHTLAFVAHKLADGTGWFLPFHHEIGAIYPSVPVVFLADEEGTGCQAVADLHDVAKPASLGRRDLSADDRDVLGFVFSPCPRTDATPLELSEKVRNIPLSVPEDLAVRPFISNKRRSPYLREFLQSNGVDTTGDKKVQLLEKCKLLQPDECIFPGVRNKVCASVVEYAYDPEFCERMEAALRPWFEAFVCAREGVVQKQTV